MEVAFNVSVTQAKKRENERKKRPEEKKQGVNRQTLHSDMCTVEYWQWQYVTAC